MIEFIAVADTVAVGVGVQRIGFDAEGALAIRAVVAGNFDLVVQPIHVAVFGKRIGTRFQFVTVGQTVAIFVGKLGDIGGCFDNFGLLPFTQLLGVEQHGLQRVLLSRLILCA